MTHKWLGVEEIALDELTGFPGNARRGSLAKVRESVKENGQFRSLIVRRREGKPDQILCGHTTREAMALEGYTAARCEVIECDDRKASQINLMDNRSGELGEWDLSALTAQLESYDGDFTGTGFDAADFEKLMFKGMPPPGDAPTGDDDQGGQWDLIVKCGSEARQAEGLALLTANDFEVMALIR